MDKKKDALNPKLQEIYERVMSTKVSPASQSTPKPTLPPSPQPSSPPHSIPIATNPPQQLTNSPIKKSSKTSPTIVYVILGIVFFLGYTYFWIRFFQLKLPFNLPF